MPEEKKNEIKVGNLRFDKNQMKEQPLLNIITAMVLALYQLENEEINKILHKFEVKIMDSDGKIVEF